LPPGDRQPFSYRIVLDPDAEFDAVLLGEGASGEDAVTAVRRAGRLLVPIADLSPRPAACAELNTELGGHGSAAEAVAELIEIVRRVDALPEAVHTSADPALLLLARCATRPGGLRAVYDAASAQLVRYPAAGPIPTPRRHAERLADLGLLERTFFDRLHVCPACGSSRLSVREECPACRSADIDEEMTVHHFACAHLALERAFRRGETLVCPKCRKALRHFGVDHDKPGTATVCNACAHVDGEPTIGFCCIDCGAHHDAQAVSSRDWHSYRFSAAGEEALARGAIETADASLAPAPGRETLMCLLRQGLALNGHCGRPIALIEITFAAMPSLSASHGERFSRRASTLAVDTIRGALRAIDFAATHDDGVVIYMPETAADAGLAIAERCLQRVRATLAVDLGAVARALDPKAVLQDLEAGR
jgi:hypothetical protein